MPYDVINKLTLVGVDVANVCAHFLLFSGLTYALGDFVLCEEEEALAFHDA